MSGRRERERARLSREWVDEWDRATGREPLCTLEDVGESCGVVRSMGGRSYIAHGPLCPDRGGRRDL